MMSNKVGMSTKGTACASFSVTRKLAIAQYGADPCYSVFGLGDCGCSARSLAKFLFRSVYWTTYISMINERRGEGMNAGIKSRHLLHRGGMRLKEGGMRFKEGGNGGG